MPRKFRLSVHRKNEFRKKRLNHKATELVTEQDERPTSLTISIPLEFFMNSTTTLSYDELQNRINELPMPQGWINSVKVAAAQSGCQTISFSKMKFDVATSETSVLFSLHIQKDFTWSVAINGVNAASSSTCPLNSTSELPVYVHSLSTLCRLWEYLDRCHPCTGNDDEKYKVILKSNRYSFMDVHGTQRLAHYDEKRQSIFSEKCEAIVNFGNSRLSTHYSKPRCMPCCQYRINLEKKLSYIRSTPPSTPMRKCHPSSHTNYRFLTTPEKCQRLRELHSQTRIRNQKVARLKVRIEELTSKRAISVDSSLDEELREIVTEQSPAVHECHPPGSLAQVFWENQKRAMSLKDSRSMKWDPLMIRWCLYLRHVCGNGYETLRESGAIKLPCQRTLRDYTYFTETAVGFSHDVDEQLRRAANADNCEEREKYVIIVMDEMHIKEDIVYDKHSGKVIGFCNLGEVNAQLSKLEEATSDSPTNEDPQLANSMLVFLVRGLFTNLQFPYGQFPCSSLSGDQIYQPFWEAVSRIELNGLKVLALTCDGLAANRRLFRLHDPHSKPDSVIHKVKNPFDPSRYVYFIVDPPHLLKTVRNAWANSKRRLWCNGKEIAWSHLIQLYYANRSQSNQINPGLALIPKLKYEHINLTTFSKMRVDLAAQVLSKTVSKGLEMLKKDEFAETVRFVDTFDKWFDCLNVCNLSNGKISRNAFKSPYYSKNDFRLQWLREDFMGYLKEWEVSVKGRAGFNDSTKKMMMLTSETLQGISITVRSFMEIIEFVFNIPGVTLFFSSRLNQDPIEKFFGMQRQRGGTHENPNAVNFLKNTQALRVIKTTCGAVRGNCRKGTKRAALSEIENTTPLPKRRRKH